MDPNEIEVGQDLATKAAKRLKAKCDLMYDHQDYCGMGLTYHKHFIMDVFRMAIYPSPF